MRSVRELEGLFFELVALFRPSIFIEAGAKAAEASRRASRLLEGSPIVAFEANPYTFQRFRRRHDYEMEGVDYRNQALSSAPGSVTFNLRQTDDGRPAADGQGSLLKHQTYEPGHIQVTAAATTLDATMEEFGADDCALWIDVEGATEAVLRGGAKTLKKANVVFVEVEDKEFWESQWLSEQVILELYGAGLYPVARDFETHLQWNVLCVRKSLLFDAGYLRAMFAYQKRINRLAVAYQHQ